MIVIRDWHFVLRTTRIVTSRQQDTTRRLSLPNHMASCRSAQNALLSYQQLLHAVRSSDLGDQLDDFGVIVSSIPADNKKRTLCAFGDGLENACNKGL